MLLIKTFQELGRALAKDYGMTGSELARNFLERFEAEHPSVPSGEKTIMAAYIIELEDKLKAVEDALEFYADEKNYDDDCAPVVDAVHEGVDMQDWDMGTKARAALEKIRGEG